MTEIRKHFTFSVLSYSLHINILLQMAQATQLQYQQRHNLQSISTLDQDLMSL